ncbi:hypothetical protein JCM33374_g4035 [Metschnikowia sp. JCM 33374]|nr:hypothetical protein JCM33374_g4035 [Metschnikowia sp. JCM 33374]
MTLSEQTVPPWCHSQLNITRCILVKDLDGQFAGELIHCVIEKFKSSYYQTWKNRETKTPDNKVWTNHNEGSIINSIKLPNLSSPNLTGTYLVNTYQYIE